MLCIINHTRIAAVQGSGFGVRGLGLGVWGLWFGVCRLSQDGHTVLTIISRAVSRA